MTTLNPRLSGGGAAFEQPVATPTGIEGVASLFSAAISTAGRSAPSDAELRRQREDGLRNTYANQLIKAQDLRKQGFEKEALALERKAGVDASRGGLDLGSSEVTNLVTQITGLDPEQVGFSQEEVAFRDALQTPEFENAFLATYATHPQASEGERMNVAFNSIQRQAANKNLMDITKADWNNNDGQGSRISLINDWRKTSFGGLTIAGEQGVRVTNDLVQQARLDFLTLKNDILTSRPANLPEADWKPVQDVIANTEAQLEYLESLTSTTELSADATRNIMDGLETLVEQGTITAMTQNILVHEIERNPQIFSQKGVLTSSQLQDALTALANTSSEDRLGQDESGNNPTDGSFFSSEEMSKVTVEDVQENLKAIQGIATTGYGISGNTMEGEESNWVVAINTGMANMKSMAANHEGWLTGEGYNNVFTPQFYAALESIKDSSEYTYSAVYNKTNEAIDSNITAIRAGITSRTDRDFTTYDPATNTLSFDRAAFEANRDIPPSVKAEFLGALDSFGGDFNRLMREGQVRGQVANITNRVSAELRDDEVLTRINAIDQLNVVKNRLVAPEQEELDRGVRREDLTPTERRRTPRGGEERPEGSFDFVVPSEVQQDTDFLQEVSNTASRLNASADDLLRIIGFETAGTFSPSISAPTSSATGLIQFLDATAEELGTTTADLAGMSRAEQMVWVERYLENRLRGVENPNFGDLYMAVHWPAGIGKDDSFVMYREGSDAYSANRSLDVNGDGTVTRGEAVARASGGASGVSFPAATGAPRVSARPERRPIDLEVADVSFSSSRGAGVDTPQSPSQPRTEGSQSAQVSTQPRTSGEAAERSQRVWSQLSDQTRNMLIRLFGNEEGAIDAIANGEISEEDIL